MNPEAFGGNKMSNLSAIFDQVKAAINNNIKQSVASQGQIRMNQKAVIANKANTRKALFSSMPAQRLTQFDSTKFVPGVATMIVNGLKRQYDNQQNWDKRVKYIEEMNKQAAELEAEARKL